MDRFGLRQSMLVLGMFCMFSMSALAETVIRCPVERNQSKAVPDSAPYEQFQVSQCWCASAERVEKGMDDLQSDVLYQAASSLQDIRTELIRVLGIKIDYQFIATRAPNAAKGSEQAKCLTDDDINRYVQAAKRARDELPPDAFDPIEVNIRQDQEKNEENNDFGEADPEELAQQQAQQRREQNEPNIEQEREREKQRQRQWQEGQQQARAQARLDEAKEFHERTFKELNTKINNTASQLDQARTRLKRLEDALQRRREGEGVFERIDVFVSGLFGDGDPAIRSFEQRISNERNRVSSLTRQLETLRRESANRASEAAKLERRLEVEVTKATTASREREQAKRLQEAIDLQLEVSLRSQLLGAALSKFEQQSAKKRKIANEFRRRGDENGAQAFEDEARKIDEQRQRYLDIASSGLNGAVQDLEDTFRRNRREEIGPNNSLELAQIIREQGKPVDVVLRADASQQLETVERTANRLAGSAPRSKDQTSVFLEVNQASIIDLIRDQGRFNAQYWENPALYFKRYGAYIKGAGRAVKDGVVDLGVLVYETGDLGGEFVEQALRSYSGIDLDLFGSENREFVENAYRRATTPDGKATYVTLENFSNFIERRFARAAGAGEKGVEAFLEDTGYVFTTVVGGEELVFKAISKGRKTVKIVLVERRIARLKRINRAADAASDVARSGNIAETVTDAQRAVNAGVETVTINTRPFAPLPDPSLFAPLPDAPPGIGNAGRIPNDPFAPRNPFAYTGEDIARLFPGQANAAAPGFRNAQTELITQTPNGSRSPFAGDDVSTNALAGPQRSGPQPGTPAFRNAQTELTSGTQPNSPTPSDIAGSNTSDTILETPVVKQTPPSQSAKATPTDGSQMRPGESLPPVDAREIDVDSILDSNDKPVVVFLDRGDAPKLELVAEQDLLGGGSFTEAYRAPNRPQGSPPIVIKITKLADDAILDDYGYSELARLNNVEVPKVHSRYRTKQGGRITVVDETPPSVKKRAGVDANGRANPPRLTPGELNAYRNGIEELNANDRVFLDNHADNYTFRIATEGANAGKSVLVVLDTGGVLPIKSGNPGIARELQRAIDAPSDTIRDYFSINKKAARLEFHKQLAERFDQFIDWAAYNQRLRANGYTGPDFTSLDASKVIGGFQYLPTNGITNPQFAAPPIPVSVLPFPLQHEPTNTYHAALHQHTTLTLKRAA